MYDALKKESLEAEERLRSRELLDMRFGSIEKKVNAIAEYLGVDLQYQPEGYKCVKKFGKEKE